MKYDHGTENLPMDATASTGSPNASATEGGSPKTIDSHWRGGRSVNATYATADKRHAVASKPMSPAVTPRAEHLKLHVSSYMSREGETHLRWLVELDIAITARRIVDPLSKVAFAVSWLGGQARCWAYGCRLTDPRCFSTYEAFKEELKLAFGHPQNEFRSRAEFLYLLQGKQDVHAYVQRARYFVSEVVTNPIDEATKVVTFMKGLKDGPVKTYLLLDYISTFEAAITLAMQAEYSIKHAKRNVPRPQRPVVKIEGPEPMNLSNATAVGKQRNDSNI
ncbi:Uncharacterized protein PHPALM_13847 [Phytophthora palmivora]|uniref:Retrotransposon gag domain-containing protein n=1 Tax=Phytophthora palmivora TaxID=4796 RepID=A0A2P4XWK3_9STRA|nr:Uncharacterized protein PHPALM_13847 [Phytophthora palmivora]